MCVTVALPWIPLWWLCWARCVGPRRKRCRLQRTSNISVLAYQRPCSKFYSCRIGDWPRQRQCRVVAHQPDPILSVRKKHGLFWQKHVLLWRQWRHRDITQGSMHSTAQHTRRSKAMVDSFGSFSTCSFCKNVCLFFCWNSDFFARTTVRTSAGV